MHIEPRITLKHDKGDIRLCIAHPLGLVPDLNARREDYGVVFIPALKAQEIYFGMPSGNTEKMHFILDSHFSAHVYEVPLLARGHDRKAFQVLNDSHVLAALVAAGVDPVPVVVHVADAAGLVTASPPSRSDVELQR